MVFPKQTLTVVDPGLGITSPAANIPVYSGIAHGGSQAVNTLGSINDISQIRSVIGYGPLAEDVALALSQRGGPIYFIIHDSVQNVALSAVALTLSGTSPAITVSGSPNDRYAVKVEIMLGGALGTSRFRYSLDAHDANYAAFTWSQERLTPTGFTFVIPGTALTLTFAAGTYVLGDSYTIATTPQEPGTVDLALAAAVLIAATQLNFNQWMLSGAQPLAATGSSVASALSGHLTTLSTSFRYVRAICDVGSGDTSANVNTETINWTSARICPVYGYELRSSLMAFEGFSTRKCSSVSGFAARAAKELISTDLARFASGADEGVLKIFFDGFSDNTLDSNKISTMRTWPGVAGYYFAGAKLKSAFGSDFTDLQFGRVMDVACRTTYEAQQPFIAESLRTIGSDLATDEFPAGSIDPRDAKAIEAVVLEALKDKLTRPNNARGNPGHVSAASYAVDRTVNIITTAQLRAKVSLRPLGYPKDISTSLSYTLQ